MKRVDKPWGGELWIAHNQHYAFKRIEIKAGHRSSLQYHREKHEHIYIHSGRLKATLQDDAGRLIEREFGPGEVIENAPKEQHRIEAVEDVVLFEVSTPQLDDVVRVEDDYQREEA